MPKGILTSIVVLILIASVAPYATAQSSSSASVTTTTTVKRDTLKFTPTALGVEEVLTNMLRAVGADSLRKVKDRTSVGTFTMHVGDKDGKGSLMTVEKAPNARADRMVIVGKQIAHIIDGVHSWRTDSNGVFYELTGNALRSDLSQAIFNPVLHLHDKNVVVALLGTTEVDSVGKCYALKIQFKDAYPFLWYVSARTWLIVQIGQPVEGRLMWQKFSDFNHVDGVMYPFTIEVTGPLNFSIHYDHIRNNTDPDPSTFTPTP